jgi:hypothetical protein
VKHKREARVAVATSALLGMVASLIFVTVVSRDPAKLSSESVLVKLQTCMKTYESVRQVCLEELIIKAVEDGVYQPLGVAMGDLEERDGWFKGDCHVASHRAGPKLLSFYERRVSASENSQTEGYGTTGSGSGNSIKAESSMLAAFTDLDTNVCGSSIGHGLAEAFANSPRTLKEWQELLQDCDTLQSTNMDIEIGCAHGVGHALVIASTKNFSDPSLAGATVSELIEFCERNIVGAPTNTSGISSDRSSTETIKQSCSYGVMMGAFAPIAEKMIKLENADILISHCKAAKQESIRRGCFAGAGFALGRNLEKLEKTNESLAEMLLACNSLENNRSNSDSEVEVTCREQVLLHIGLNVNSYTEILTDAIPNRCSGLEESFGRQLAVSCIANMRRSVDLATFNEIGPTGTSVLRL